MPLPVALKAVADEMETGTDGWQAYINRKTGELASFREEARRAVEDDDPPDGWELEEYETCKRVLDDPDFIEPPNQRDIHEYSIMERFCHSRSDGEERDSLLDAIAGRGAFRMFKSTIHRRGIEQEWYRYRNEAVKQIAIDFLEAHGIPYADNGATG